VKVRLPNIFRLRSVIALALMFWCAGTGCLIVGYARAASAEEMAAPAAKSLAAAASTSMDAHACCKARHSSVRRNEPVALHHKRSTSGDSSINEVSLPASPMPASAMSCCPLTSGSIVAGSRSQSNDQTLVLNTADSLSGKAGNLTPAPISIPLRLPNHAESYLLDCVFLI